MREAVGGRREVGRGSRGLRSRKWYAMSDQQPASPVPLPASRVNDFAFKMGTVNGTGSASANTLLMQSIFRMGIPVSGKNVFPSNIQGLPTWYEIRVSKD